MAWPRSHGLALALGLSLIGLSALAPPHADAAPAPARADVAAAVAEAESRFGLPAGWIIAVIDAESAGDPRAVSPKGALGLMQLMPRTWRDLRSRYGLGDDPFDVHDNIIAGAAYLSLLYQAYGAPGFLAAYNAGPERWRAFTVAGVALPPETRRYVSALAPALGLAAADPALATREPAWRGAPLFVGASAPGGAQSGSSALFAVRGVAPDSR
jgi:soluble lytic murein transglycosylase-like protein